jgi:hypothetical protein
MIVIRVLVIKADITVATSISLLGLAMVYLHVPFPGLPIDEAYTASWTAVGQARLFESSMFLFGFHRREVFAALFAGDFVFLVLRPYVA